MKLKKKKEMRMINNLKINMKNSLRKSLSKNGRYHHQKPRTKLKKDTVMLKIKRKLKMTRRRKRMRQTSLKNLTRMKQMRNKKILTVVIPKKPPRLRPMKKNQKLKTKIKAIMKTKSMKRM